MTENRKNGKKTRKAAVSAKNNGRHKSKESLDKDITELKLLTPHEHNRNSNNVTSHHHHKRRHSHANSLDEERLSLKKQMALHADDVMDVEARITQKSNKRSRCICIAASAVLLLIFSGES